MKIGCHVSIAGGIQNAPKNAFDLGCEVFQMFTRSPRGGEAPELTVEAMSEFFEKIKTYGFSEYVIHTPYFINFGSKNSRIFHGSVQIVREELERASVLKAAYVMTHLGSYKDLGVDMGQKQLINGLKKVLTGYLGECELLLELSAGAGEVIGDTFEELASILDDRELKKFKLGICFDTAHAFASGYDLRTAKAVRKTLEDFDKIIGLDRLKVIHANDSKVELAGKKDRHDHIGDGKIGKAGFAVLLRYQKLKKVNMYLETEHDKVKEDINILKSLR